jgi:calcineurin-like phosphoesterase family protein
MTIWVTADQHFGHENIIKYCERPFKNAHHMDRTLIRNFNELVAPEDTTYMLGDFTMVGPQRANYVERLLRKLHGTKILILGNHDRIRPIRLVELGFRSVHTSLVLGDLLMVHDPAWAEVWPMNKPAFCGHIHRRFKQQGTLVNVGVDVWDYKPVLYEDALALALGKI